MRLGLGSRGIEVFQCEQVRRVVGYLQSSSRELAGHEAITYRSW